MALITKEVKKNMICMGVDAIHTSYKLFGYVVYETTKNVTK